MARLSSATASLLLLLAATTTPTLARTMLTGAAAEASAESQSVWGPAIASDSNSRIVTYSAKERGALYSSGNFGAWDDLGGVATSKPGAAASHGTNLVSVIGSDRAVYFLTQTSGGGGGNPSYEWRDYNGLSCMDDGGYNYKTYRDTSTSECKRKCEQDSRCHAITHSHSNTCYLKESCKTLTARNNGDNSAVLTRGGGGQEAEWQDYDNLSCMDNGGDNYKAYRDMNGMDDCKSKCVSDSGCNAVTYSKSHNCYLKTSCHNLEARNNGDDSAVLRTRGGGGGGSTSSWTKIPTGTCISAPAVAAHDDRFDLVCVGTDNQPYAHQIYNGSPSGRWSEMGGLVKPGTSPAAAGMNNGRTFVFVVGMDSRLWWTKSDSDGNGWGSWSGSLPSPGEAIRGSPALASQDGLLYVFVIGSSGKPYFMSMDKNGSVREYWQGMGNANCASDMAATGTCYDKGSSSCITAMCYGTDDKIWYTYVTSINGVESWHGTSLQAP